jgi:cyclopropane fatty-acyl-phospholipid synthase-like methyltransferase
MRHFVFPDGELHEVGIMAQAMQARCFEVRDVESLREHHDRTLVAWLARLYLASAAVAVRLVNNDVHQLHLGRRLSPPPRGQRRMPG